MLADPILILALAAFLIALIGAAHLVRAWQLREIEVLSRDQTRLVSNTLGLAGRPDRLIRLKNGTVIPLEMKSTKKIYDSHRIQIAAYLLLVEETYGERPPHGFVVLGDGSKIKIKNTHRLRRWALKTAKQIRNQRFDLTRPTKIWPTPAKCRSCGFRQDCRRRAG